MDRFRHAAYVAWRAGMTNRVVGRTVQARHAGNRFLGSLKCLQIRALYVLTATGSGHTIFFFLLYWCSQVYCATMCMVYEAL